MGKEKIKKCPFCGENVKIGNGYHLNSCDGYKVFLDKNKEDIISLYLDEKYSVLELSKKYCVPYSIIQSILRKNNVKIRGIKESKFTERVKEKYEKTMLEHYGCKHNFEKECSSRKQWERRLLDEEGIVNVFQRKDVIEKIKNTMHNKYTDDEIYYNYTKGSTLQYWIDKLGEEEGKKEYEKICFNKGKSNRLEYYIELFGEVEGENLFKQRIHNNLKKMARSYHTSINERMNNLLKDNNFLYDREYVIHREDKKGYFSYDFIVEKTLLIEMNGVFWHADPRIYKENDILNFPGRKVIAKDIWEKDKIKNNLAINKGYKTLTLWENDFNNMTNEEILKIINYEINKN